MRAMMQYSSRSWVYTATTPELTQDEAEEMYSLLQTGERGAKRILILNNADPDGPFQVIGAWWQTSPGADWVPFEWGEDYRDCLPADAEPYTGPSVPIIFRCIYYLDGQMLWAVHDTHDRRTAREFFDGLSDPATRDYWARKFLIHGEKLSPEDAARAQILSTGYRLAGQGWQFFRQGSGWHNCYSA